MDSIFCPEGVWCAIGRVRHAVGSLAACSRARLCSPRPKCSAATMLITLTTDFGLHDWFAGVMHGVILGLNRRASIVPITHQIPPGDIRSGAFALAAAYRYFP